MIQQEMLPLFQPDEDNLDDLIQPIVDRLALLSLDEQIDLLNRVRTMLHQVSPFRNEPVDLVLWKPSEQVEPNDYNPNIVHRPEMKLLQTSMLKHVTQPVVTGQVGESGTFVVTDGEHRYITITTCKPLSARLHGYVPITVTAARTREEQMADTVEHNRARGVHTLDGMTNIVLSMLAAGWTDDEIARHLGMDADEILRMKQVSGIAQAFTRPAYNRAWINDDGQETLD